MPTKSKTKKKPKKKTGYKKAKAPVQVKKGLIFRDLVAQKRHKKLKRVKVTTHPKSGFVTCLVMIGPNAKAKNSTETVRLPVKRLQIPGLFALSDA